MRLGKRMFLLVLLSLIFGFLLAWTTQYLPPRKTGPVSTNVELCLGPDVAGYVCPKVDVPIMQKGYPVAFYSKIDPIADPSEVGYKFSDEKLSYQFNRQKYTSSAVAWSVLILLIGVAVVLTQQRKSSKLGTSAKK